MKTLLTSLLGQFLPLSRSEREQNVFNQRMAEDAFNRQVEFHEKFNTPAAMVKQYEEAGINPALVSGYSPSMPPSSQAASGSGGSPAFDALQLAMQIKMQNKELQMQERRLDIDEKLADADIANKDADTRNKEIENASAEEFYQLRNESILSTIRKDAAATENLYAQKSLLLVEKSIKDLDLEFYSKVKSARESAYLAAARATEAQSDMTIYEAENYAYRYALELKNVIAQTELSNAHAAQVRAYTKEMLTSPGLDADGKVLLSRVAQMTDAEIEQMKKDNKGRVWRNWISTVSGAAASGAVAAGALKMFFPAAKAASVIAAPLGNAVLRDGYGSFDRQYGTFDTNM